MKLNWVGLLEEYRKEGQFYISCENSYSPGNQPLALYNGQLVQKIIFGRFYSSIRSQAGLDMPVQRLVESIQGYYPELSLSLEEIENHQKLFRPDVFLYDSMSIIEISSIGSKSKTRKKLLAYLKTFDQIGLNCKPGDTSFDIFKGIIKIPQAEIIFTGLEPGYCAYKVLKREK